MLELMGHLPMGTAITSSQSAEFSELALLNHRRRYKNFTILVGFLLFYSWIEFVLKIFNRTSSKLIF